MKNIAILVLAAGKSSRMKSVKQLLKLQDKTILEVVLDKALLLSPKNTFCVLGANASKIKETVKNNAVQFIINDNYEKGLSESIKTGMYFFEQQKYNFDAVLVLLADQPAIQLEYLKNMMQEWNTNFSRIIASNYGSSIGVPAIFPKNYYTDLKEIKGDSGAKKLLLKNKSSLILSKFPTSLIDLDTPEDYQRYLQHSTQQQS